MKKLIYASIATFLLFGMFATSCSSAADKVENAEAGVDQANDELNAANKQYEEELNAYRTETYEKISANEKSVAEFKLRIENEKKDAKADYNKKIAELEQQNSDMKKRMDDYKSDGRENWENFKTEFNNDMNKLGEAFKNLFVNDDK
jgi:DNA anti-recombination protein RmuC